PRHPRDLPSRPARRSSALACEIGNVSRCFAREHRIARVAAFLRAFDLGIPIGALDEPHVEPSSRLVSQLAQPTKNVQRPLLISLDRKSTRLNSSHVKRSYA